MKSSNRSGSESSFVESILFIPGCKFRRPGHHVRPHQIAELPDLELGIKLGSKVHEMKKRPQTEACNEVLAVIEGKNPTGMFFGESCAQQIPIALIS